MVIPFHFLCFLILLSVISRTTSTDCFFFFHYPGHIFLFICLFFKFWLVVTLQILFFWMLSKFSIVFQLLSQVPLFATPWTVAHQASLSRTVSQRFLKFISIESVMLSNHFILCSSLLLLPSIFPSIRAFSISQLFTSDGQISELQLQQKSFQRMFSFGLLYYWLVWSPCSPRYSQASCSAPQFESIFCAQVSLWSNSHICTWLLEKS